ncbi:MAG: hypothetical protein GY953_38120 [bacterium]|nr:hypothetical protein [bacterium]
MVFAGSVSADGNGAVTAWMDASATPAENPAPPAFKSVRPFTDIFAWTGRDIRYEVEPDCRITISGTIVTPDGLRISLVLVGALADGGRTALLINGSSGSPFLITTTMKRAEGTSRDELMDLLQKIANRLGLITN